MKNTCLALICGVVTACGSVDSDNGISASESEFGQVQEALTIPPEYGNAFSPAGDACTMANNTQGHPCDLPLDRIIKPRWSGPCTDSHLPGIDLCTAFNNAFSLIAPQFQSAHWTISKGTSSSNEFLHVGSLGGCRLGQTDTGFASQQPSSVTTQVGGTFWFVKSNKCDITISPANIAVCAPQSEWQKSTEMAMAHEIAHCGGLPHRYPNNCTNLMNPSQCSPPQTIALDSTQRFALDQYRP